MTRTTALLALLALTLPLTACRQDVAPDGSAAPTATDTPPTTATTAEPPTPTEEADSTYPTDLVEYGDRLVQAWAADDDDEVGRLAVREIELATGSWSTEDVWGEPRETDLGQLGAEFAGLRALWYDHGDVARLVITVDTAALGGEDAVVGLDLQLLTTDQGEHGRTSDNPLNIYADAFHEAVVARDAATLERLGSAEIAASLMAVEPDATGGVIVDQGVWSYRDEPIDLLFSYADADPADDPMLAYVQVLEVDPDLALEGADHAVTGLDVVTDARWT